MQQWISETLKTFPYLVATIENQVVGYAYAGSLRSRCAYSWSVEVSVYISNKFHRRGIGKALYLKLFEILKSQNVVNVFAGIALPNEASLKMHGNLGFQKIGVYKNIGFKHNKWWDVSWWQLPLQSPEIPIELIPYSYIF